jgi:EAL and modified HD-GYP domain-containing signal transduction protein
MAVPEPEVARSATELPPNVFLGRQPIADSQLRTVGYELLYRSANVGAAVFDDGNRATSNVLANLLLEFGLDRVVGEVPAWVNFPESYLVEEMPIPIPATKLVVEVLEDVKATEDTLLRLEHLVDQGYLLALDDCVFNTDTARFLPLATYVKLDVRGLGREEIARQSEPFRKHPVKLVAEKVETMADFEICQKLGFDFYQGYFMCRPETLSKRRLPANRLTLVQVLAEIHSTDTRIDRIEALIEQDVALSYRLLRALNSAVYALPRKVESIRQALMMLGLNRLRNLISLLVLGGVAEKPGELVRTALVRARTCESLARLDPQLSPDAGFTVGLFSILDALLDTPMDRIVSELPLSPEIIEAISQRKGFYGRLLRGVEAHERGEFEGAEQQGIEYSRLLPVWFDAIAWADSIMALAAEQPPSPAGRAKASMAGSTLRPRRIERR